MNPTRQLRDAGQSLSLPCGSMPIDPLYRRVLP